MDFRDCPGVDACAFFFQEARDIFSRDINMGLSYFVSWWEKEKAFFLKTEGALGFLLLVAFILFLVGIALLARRYKDAHIFERAWTLFLVPLIGGSMLVILYGFFGILFSVFLGLASTMESEMQMFFMALMYPLFAFGLIMGFLVIVATIVIPMWQMRKLSESLSSHTGVSLFKVAGKWFFWGGWLSLLPFVGEIVMMVGWILFSLGAFQKITLEREGK